MAEAPDTLANARGERLRFVTLPRDPERDALVVEVRYLDGDAPPAHLHPRQRERFEVLRGVLEVSIAGERSQRTPGDVFEVEPGVVHAMRAVGEAGATFRWTITPALGTERFFRCMWALDAAHGGRPGLLRLARVLRAHRREFRLARPPEPLQGVLVGAVAALARLLDRR